MMNRFLILVLLLISLLAFPTTADADHKNTHSPKGTQQVFFSPPTVAVGESFVITASGFLPLDPSDYQQTVVHVSAATPGCCLAFNTSADADGNVGPIGWTPSVPGVYRFTFLQDPNPSFKNFRRSATGYIEVTAD